MSASSVVRIQGIVVAVALTGMAFAWPDPPQEQVNKKPSTYASAKALEYQLVYLMDRLEDDLEDEGKFDRRAKRIVRDASTIAALALVMGKHDEANGVGARAGGIIRAANALAANANSHADAAAAYAKLVASCQAPTTQPVEWKCVADIEQLMLQVPQLNTSLKSNTKASRFDTSREKAAGLAAALAAVAQVSMFDQSYCDGPVEHAEWVGLCVQMRDSAHGVYKVIQDGNVEAVESAMQPLSRSCDDCHEKFRD